jgi:hypothetical protein
METHKMPLEHNDELEQRLRNVPWGEVPTQQTLPDQAYLLSIVDISSQPTRNGKYMILVESVVVEPTDYAGRTHREGFVIGTDKDPEALQTETWRRSIAASNLKLLTNVCNVDNPLNLKGKQYKVCTRTEADDNGTLRTNSVQPYFPATDPSLSPGDATPQRSRPRRQRTTTTVAQPVDPNVPLECSTCRQMFPQETIFTHMETCSRQTF